MAKKKKQPPGKGARKVRVDFRANRAEPARDHSWTQQYREHGFEETDTDAAEHVTGKGALSRKRTVTEDPDEAKMDALGWQRGRVVAMRGLIAEVDTGAEVYACTIRRVLRTRRIEERHPVATGDLVRFAPDPADERNPNVVPFDYNIRVSPGDFDVDALPTGVVEWVASRGACLTRKSGRRTHTVVANVDQAVVVSSVAEPYCKPHLIDRYLVSAHAGGIAPLVCINKTDLDEDGAILEVVERYAGLGYRVLRTSAVTGRGVDELAEALCGRSSVIVGQSGVGKSSLLNVVQPELGLRVARVSEQTEKGRHTTSTAQLHRLLVGGYVVDTPGVKSFELAEVPLNELEMYFIDIAAHVADCKYPNCTHIHEDNCAVKRAVDDARIHPARYESYVKMFMGE